eukprot:TRINITY_DN2423_c0_g4_i7.p3 TRINITY_DN2423_c0_g4~~TRINITY_DN2423_c0_g4_i7.p3  ORF type:complete len:232 (+),score=97.84 TRINITY_DN2423_c0_g4_i7:979-1674(+)
MQLKRMQKMLGKYTFFYLNQVMTIPERSELYTDFEKVFEKGGTMEECSYMKFDKFFKSQSKLDLFKKYYIDGSENLSEFKTQILAGTYHRPEEPIKKVPKEVTPVFSEGVDIFKAVPEAVSEIAINFCSAKLMALATDRGSREVNIRHSLLFRRRSRDGLKLQDEEAEDWNAGLHRFERAQESPQSSFVSACIRKLLNDEEERGEFASFDSAEVIEWSQKNYKEYYMVSAQ